jgi:psp operon transcriptional activator
LSPCFNETATVSKVVANFRAALPNATAHVCYERRLLEEALPAARFNRRRAAARLGLSYDQLRTRLRRHGLAREGGEVH